MSAVWLTEFYGKYWYSWVMSSYLTINFELMYLTMILQEPCLKYGKEGIRNIIDRFFMSYKTHLVITFNDSFPVNL